MSQSEEAAEKLAAELAEARAEATRLAEELKATQKEQELMRRLASEGTRDLEAAVLIAKARLAKDEKSDIGGVVEQLKKEKQYLFCEKTSESVAVRTSPAKEAEKSSRHARTSGEEGRRDRQQERFAGIHEKTTEA